MSATSTFTRARGASRSSRGSTDSTDSALSYPDPALVSDLGVWEEREEEEGQEEGIEGDYTMVDAEEREGEDQGE